MVFSLVGKHQLKVFEAAERGEAFAKRTFIPSAHGVSDAWTNNGLLKPAAVLWARGQGFIEYIPMEQPRMIRIVMTDKGRKAWAEKIGKIE